MYKLSNHTTGISVDFEYSLADGEKLTIDFTPGDRKMESNYAGKIWGLVPGSDFTSFSLNPGVNEISLYVPNISATITAEIQWRDSYMGVD